MLSFTISITMDEPDESELATSDRSATNVTTDRGNDAHSDPTTQISTDSSDFEGAAGGSSQTSMSNWSQGSDDTLVTFDETGIISEVNFEFTPGPRVNTQLVYLKNEKCLYTHINSDKSGKRFKCRGDDCKARLTIRANGVLEKSKANYKHSLHGTHENLRKQYLMVDNMKKGCSDLNLLCGNASQSLSVRRLYDHQVLE